MAKEIAYVLINPYSILKSRTGGILSRLMSRTGLDLVEACLFTPCPELVAAYAEDVRKHLNGDQAERDILADYILRAYAPGADGTRKRVILLLFEGEQAIEKIYQATGPLRPGLESGETVRDTYGDLIIAADGNLVYVEPAVLVGRDRASTARALRLWGAYAARDAGLLPPLPVEPGRPESQRTLVLIKCDTFRFPGSRPGQIVDLFSRSGLRIVGIKVHRMSCREAITFYQPLRDAMGIGLRDQLSREVKAAISERLGIELPPELITELSEKIAPIRSEQQFLQLVGFVTGIRPDQCLEADWDRPGEERCLALVYEGPAAVEKIHAILGPADIAKAGPGTVRRELGAGMMLHAAHASNTPESAEREINLIGFRADALSGRIEKYLH